MKTIQSKLRLFLISISVIGMATFSVVSVGYAAGAIQSIDYTSLGDYRAAYGSSAWYNTDKYHSSKSSNGNGDDAINYRTDWQALGATAGQNDYGVSWSTNGVDFGHGDLFVNDTVTFKFNMYSDTQGSHYANIFKSWIDWGVGDDGPSFDNATGSDPGNVIKTGSNIADNSSRDWLTDGQYFEKENVFTFTKTLTEAEFGTAYLRARVTCTESILRTNSDKFNTGTGWYDQWDYTTDQYESAFDAYSDYNQGEIEDWKFTVSRRSDPGNPVPEPATFALFGMGLIGLARWGRKKA